MKTAFLASAVAGLLATQAQAHVVLSPGEAKGGAYYAGAFRVSHGCSGSPTVAVTVLIPAGIVTAKPQPKPGWTLQIEREPLAAPVSGEGGQVLRERVRSITWRGRLPDDQFDEFAVMGRLPEGAGPLYFPVVQTCEAGETRWDQVPGPASGKLSRPAPALNVGNAAAAEPSTRPMGDMEAHHH